MVNYPLKLLFLFFLNAICFFLISVCAISIIHRIPLSRIFFILKNAISNLFKKKIVDVTKFEEDSNTLKKISSYVMFFSLCEVIYCMCHVFYTILGLGPEIGLGNVRTLLALLQVSITGGISSIFISYLFFTPLIISISRRKPSLSITNWLNHSMTILIVGAIFLAFLGCCARIPCGNTFQFIHFIGNLGEAFKFPKGIFHYFFCTPEFFVGIGIFILLPLGLVLISYKPRELFFRHFPVTGNYFFAVGAIISIVFLAGRLYEAGYGCMGFDRILFIKFGDTGPDSFTLLCLSWLLLGILFAIGVHIVPLRKK